MHAHQVALLDADAVLAGQHAADLDAEPQDVGAELLGALAARRACWRRTGSAGADCRRRHGRRWRRAGRTACDSSRIRPAPRPVVRAGSCRPCRYSRARSGRRRGTRPCGRPRTAAAPARRGSTPDRRGAAAARRSSSTRVDQIVDLDRAGRRARRSAAPRHRADSRLRRRPRRRGSPAGPSSPCRPG